MRGANLRDGSFNAIFALPVLLFTILLSGPVAENISEFVDINEFLNITENSTIVEENISEFMEVGEYLNSTDTDQKQKVNVVNITIEVFQEDYLIEKRGGYFITLSSEGQRTEVAKNAFEKLSENETVRLLVEDEEEFEVIETDKRELGKLIRDGADRIYVDSAVKTIPAEEMAIDENLKVCILDTGVGEEDANGHGTVVASYVKGEILSVKVLDENGIGYSSDVIEGIEECIEENADVILMYFGYGRFDSDCDDEAIVRAAGKAVEKGIIVISPEGDSAPGCGNFISHGFGRNTSSKKLHEIAVHSAVPSIEFEKKMNEEGWNIEFEKFPIKKIEIFNTTGDAAIEVDSFEKPGYVQAYAINPKNITMGAVTATAKGTTLYKCKDWNFSSQTCYGEWVKLMDIVPGEEYRFILTGEDPGFAESLEILNIQSYPEVRGEWTVEFTTNGTGDLTIGAVNGTTWSNSDETEDLKLIEIKCGENNLAYNWINNSVFIENYSCNETAYETSKVLTEGKHHLEFRFGNITRYAHNLAGRPPYAILLRGAAGNVDSATDVNVTWSIEDREDIIAFNHSTAADTQIVNVKLDGVYRVSYGLYITTTGGGRYQPLSHVLVDGADSEICYGSGYNRGTTSSQDLVSVGECLLNLSAGQNISVVARRVSSSAVQNPSLTSAQSWMHVQKIDDPDVIMLREVTGGDAFDAANVNVTWDTEDREDSAFSHATGSDEIQVLKSGFYRLTYGIGITQNGDNRTSAFGKIQLQPDGGSFADVAYGWSHINQRGLTTCRDAALSVSTLLNLTALDTVKVVVGRASTVDPGAQTLVGNRIHFDMEYLGDDKYANTMLVYDAAGGDDIDPGPVDQTWDTENWEGTDFSYTPIGSEITAERTGLYHIAYGIYTERTLGGTRFEWVTSLRINDVEQNVCYGSGYNRGDQGTYDSYTGGSESNCYIELNAGDRIEIRNTKVSNGAVQTIPVTGNRTFLTIQSMDYNVTPDVVLNAPANDSNFTDVGNIILNATVSDVDDTSLDVEFFAGNSSTISDANGLVYIEYNVTNGSTLTYNITALPFIPDADTNLLLHFDNRSEYGENDNLAYDFSGTGNNATCAGASCPTFNQTGGKFGGAFELDGIDDYWNIDNGFFDAAVANRTTELWFKANDVSSPTNQFLYEEGGGVNGFDIYIRSGRVYVGAWVEGAGWNGEWLSFPTTSNEWHYVALLFEGNNKMSIVYDGLYKTVSVPTTMLGHGGDDFIGRMGTAAKTDQGDQGGGPTFYFNGTIDEFAIYNRTLTIEEATDHYRLKSGTYYWYVNASDGKATGKSDIWQFNINRPPTFQGDLDLNNDGYEDIVFANYWDGVTSSIDSIIYYGSESGFDVSWNYTLPTIGGRGATIADLDDDGYLDIIFTNYYNGFTYLLNSTIYWGSANGFDSSDNMGLPTEGSRGAAAVADIDRDGYLDILFTNYFNGSVTDINSTIYWGSATGYDASDKSELPTNGAMSPFIADLNQDGYLDIFLTYYYSDLYASFNINSTIYWNNGTGFDSSNTTGLPGTGASGNSIEDLNGDGYPDIVMSNYYNGSEFNLNSTIYWGSEDGYDVSNTTELPTSGARGNSAGDFNLDGYLDLVFSNYYNGSDWNINSTIYWGSATGFNASNSSGLPTNGAAGNTDDIDEDGYPDIVFSNYYNGSDWNINSTIYWGSALGFVNTTGLPTQGAVGNSIAVGDGISGNTAFGSTGGATLIPGWSWYMNENLYDVFDLDIFFHDGEGDALTYTVTGNTNITVQINSTTGFVSFIPDTNWYGNETVYFTANDGLSSVNSNNVTLYVLKRKSRCMSIESEGEHILNNDVEGAPINASEVTGINWACIKIASGNVDFSCEGYNITNNGTVAAAGIVINGSVGIDYINVTIRNCPAVSGYLAGAYIHRSPEDKINNITVHGGTYGLALLDSDRNNLSDNIVYNNTQYGLYLLIGSNNNNFSNNTAYNNLDGIHLDNSHLNRIESSVVRNNTRYGLYLYSSLGNNLTDSMIYNNSNIGAYFDTNSSYSTVRNNIAYENTNAFVFWSNSRNNITNNTAYNNTNGFYFDSNTHNNTVLNNTAYIGTNGFVNYLSSDNDFIGNTAHDMNTGFYSDTNSSYNTFANNTAYENTNGFVFWTNHNNTVVNNSAYNSTTGFYVDKNADNNSFIDNKAYSNTNGFIFWSNSNNNVHNNTVYNNSNGFYFDTNTSSNTVVNNTAYDNTDSFLLWISSNNNFTGNTAYNSNRSFYINANSTNNTFSSNIAYNSTNGFFISSNSNNTLVNNTAYGNFYGVHLLNSDETVLVNTSFYNDDYDFYVNNSGVSAIIFNMTDSSFRNPSGTWENYTILSINDSVAASAAYSINWTGVSTLPSGYTSFAQKFINISTQNGTVSIDSIIWHWADSEIAGYNESAFELWKWNLSDTWTMLNDTPDTTANTLALSSMNPASDYGILYSGEIWNIIYGNISGQMLLAPDNVSIFYNWTWNGQKGKVYVMNGDVSVNWANLTAIGKNVTGENSTNDFTELDQLLGMGSGAESLTNLYSTDGTHARNTTNISIFERLVPYIPIANSSDSNIFQTGITWDASQGGPQFNTTLNQDVVFVTEINGSAAYDYEIRVPDNLDTYKGASGVVEFWLELD